MIDPHTSTIDTGNVAAAEISIVEATVPVHRGYTFIHYSSQLEHKSVSHIHCHSQSGAKVVLGKVRMACCRECTYLSVSRLDQSGVLYNERRDIRENQATTSDGARSSELLPIMY